MKKRARSSRKALAPVDVEIVTLDKKLVDDATVWIRRKLEETVYKGTLEIGNYVLDTFFKGDIEAVRSKNPQKNTSFGALTDKCGSQELPISKPALSRAVGIAMMVRQFPDETVAFKQLAPSIQETLLPLQDPAKVEKIAKKALEGEWTVLETRETVASERAKIPKDDTRGRPPTPVITKVLERSLKQFTFEDGKRSFTKADVEALGEDQRENALKSAQELIEKLKELVGKLKKA